MSRGVAQSCGVSFANWLHLITIINDKNFLIQLVLEPWISKAVARTQAIFPGVRSDRGVSCQNRHPPTPPPPPWVGVGSLPGYRYTYIHLIVSSPRPSQPSTPPSPHLLTGRRQPPTPPSADRAGDAGRRAEAACRIRMRECSPARPPPRSPRVLVAGLGLPAPALVSGLTVIRFPSWRRCSASWRRPSARRPPRGPTPPPPRR